MMEQDILTQLYFGKITPWEKRSGTDPEMDALRDRIDAETKALESMLPQEGVELLTRLLSDCSDLEARAVCEGFKDGYRLGTKLTAAAFCGDKVHNSSPE